jgi:hypothetical protein
LKRCAITTYQVGLNPQVASSSSTNHSRASIVTRNNTHKSQLMEDRLFIGVYPTGIVYADRTREVRGDYARLAYLPFSSLELEIMPNCPQGLRDQIIADAAAIQARRGEQYRISAAGQTITLGKNTGECLTPPDRAAG